MQFVFRPLKFNYEWNTCNEVLNKDFCIKLDNIAQVISSYSLQLSLISITFCFGTISFSVTYIHSSLFPIHALYWAASSQTGPRFLFPISFVILIFHYGKLFIFTSYRYFYNVLFSVVTPSIFYFYILELYWNSQGIVVLWQLPHLFLKTKNICELKWAILSYSPSLSSSLSLF